ncbi:uncharacterized protein K460DRAFT_399646 [Cucurbitaria berberidis CBS 394.84]|uniref:CENP-V/GFA domain-containing protein n=1 Tax=Cucurbitaria berberidis CBS 394.84 TaxID=1168544 RepID=A0A9P4G6Q6_9PLEO|nr:uncharacterized protein K460DRAFT_399646 [Cucurbitaria berberidis CBS 394.84]KAF1840031.1 hypothetical protein K460DRAFT_399646 [Cucurbitaria berberidis CBS 394.84]
MSKSDVSLPTAPAPDAPTAIYKASCHCGAFAYTITQAPPLNDPSAQVMDCNCSICSRNGYLFIYTSNDRVEFTKGGIEQFKTYSFASKKMAHYFCGTCGASCMARSVDPSFFPGMTCVNVRMLEGVDLKTLNLKFADGASFDPTSA